MSAECPYGWTPDPTDPRRMVPCRREREVMGLIASWRAGGASYRAITRRLNESPDTRGLARHGAWNAKTVRKICLDGGCG